MSSNGPLRVGIGGPVGAGKTTLTEQLCRAMAPKHSMAVITNDIYTREDAEFLLRAQALPEARIKGVETGGCPHTAIRELVLSLIVSGGDKLSATFSPELADLSIYVIDTAAGQDIPRKKGPGVTRSDLLVINKTDLAPHVGVDVDLLEKDAAVLSSEPEDAPKDEVLLSEIIPATEILSEDAPEASDEEDAELDVLA